MYIFIYPMSREKIYYISEKIYSIKGLLKKYMVLSVPTKLINFLCRSQKRFMSFFED